MASNRKPNTVRCDPEFLWIHGYSRGWQFGEAGMVLAAATAAGYKAADCCEFGAGDGNTTELVTDPLIEAGWKAHLFECGIGECARLREKMGDKAIILNTAITPQNVNDVVPKVDLLVIDIDGADYYIWEAYAHSPAFVLIEHADWCNTFVPDSPDVPPLTECGAEIDNGPIPFKVQANESAVRELATAKGYTRIFATRINSFFARNDVAEKLKRPVADGYVNPPDRLEIHHLPEVAELPYKDGSIGEVLACHVLEHYPAQNLSGVLREWVRVLKPGGKLRLSVPDFRKIAEGYLSGRAGPWTAFAFGSQHNSAEFHKSGIDETLLRGLMSEAGLVRVQPWKSDRDDVSASPISLNLEGLKPTETLGDTLSKKIVACMSIPRLGFTSNMFCAMSAFVRHRIVLDTIEGAFWGQCLENCMERHLNDGTEFILTLDYDTVFTEDHIKRLVMAADLNPEIDAFAPLQCKREEEALLAMLEGDGDKTVQDLNKPIVEAKTAHFGLTLIRVSALKKMAHPWFWGQPNSEGGWWDTAREQSEEEFKGRQDDDIYFWNHFKKSGNRLALIPDMGIGHAQLVVTWPEKTTLRPVHQYWRDYRRSGPPANARA
jgi:SAM-dependent methyltransferase